MKKTSPHLVIFFVLMTIQIPGMAAVFNAQKNGNWTDPTTWGTASAPGSNDVVNIGTYQVTVAAGSSYSGNGGSAININSGGKLYVNGSWTVTGQNTNITVNTGGTIEVVGTLSIENRTKIALSGGLIKAGTLSMPDYNTNSGITYTSGTVQVTASLYVGFAATFSYSPSLAIPTNLVLKNGSTLNVTSIGGTIDVEKASVLNLVSGTYSPSTITLTDAGSTIKLSSGTLTYGTAITLDQTSLVIDGGTFTLNNSLTLSSSSTFTVASGATANIGASGSTATNFTRGNTSSATFSNAGTMIVNGSASVYGASTNTGTLSVTLDYTQQNVTNGMTSSGIFNVGRDAYALGIIQLNPGANSTMTVGQDLYVNDNPWIIVGTTVNPTCNTVITQYANLVVTRNVRLTGSGDVIVRQNGRFVVFGSMSTNGTGNVVTIDCGGQAYVHGSINLGTGGGNTVTNNNNSGSPTGSNGQPRIGLYVNGTITAQNTPSTVGTQAQMNSNDFPFYDYISKLPNSPLPVKLMYFKVATVNEQGISLEWATSMEKNFNYFEVQRSGADLNFSTIDIVQGKGGLEVKTVYSVLDDAPANGKNYYRLKAVDLDNTFEYFNVIVADWSGTDNGASLYPNPAIDRSFTIDIGDGFDQPVDVTVYEVKGYVIYSTTLNTRTTTVQLPDNISSGIYLVRVSSHSKQQLIRLAVR